MNKSEFTSALKFWRPGPGVTRVRLLLAAVAAAVLAVVVVALMPTRPMTVHGTMTDCSQVYSGGEQVIVTSPQGTVVGTGTLRDTGVASYATSLVFGTIGQALFKFTVTVPAEPRYGVQVGSGHGTVWFSAAEMRRGPALSLGC